MKFKSVVGAFLGHTLEHYDITLYGFFALFLGTLFFPDNNSTWAIFSSYVIFAAGFIMRPLGGFVFGYIGDRWGRRIALLWAILLVSLPTAMIGFLPSYQQAGIISAVALLLCRLLQGLCVGGEYSGASIFVTEHTSKDKVGLYGSILCATGFFGAVLGNLVGSICMSAQAPAWGWRIPFIIGGFFGIVGYYFRRGIEETPSFKHIQHLPRFPLAQVLKNHWKSFLCTVGVGANGLIPLYVSTIYTNLLLTTKLNVSTAQTLALNMCLMGLWCLLLPLMGMLSDKIGQVKLMSYSALVTIFVSFPSFIFLNTDLSFVKILIFQIILTCVGAAYVGPLPSFIPRLFPVQLRYTGVAFSYTIGQALFGGTAPLISKALVDYTGSEGAPALYLCFGGVLGWLGVKKARIF